MQFRRGAHIYGADDHPIGRITHIVLNPESKLVTHLVVRRGLVFREDKVVPFTLLHSLIPGRIVLDDSAGDLHNLPDFEEPCYMSVDVAEERQDGLMAGAGGNMYLNPPAYTFLEHPGEERRPPAPRHRYIMTKRQNIPEGAIALEEGASVICDDGAHAGHVESVLVNADTAQITHLLATKPVLSASRKLIPVAWINLICEDTVYLSVAESVVHDQAEQE